MKLLSIIIPVFNEPTLPKLLDKLLAVKFPMGINREILIIDDGSTDGTREWLIDNADKLNLKYFLHKKNLGKGAALRTGFLKSKGDIIIVQDADMEYDPNDITGVVMPIFNGKTKVCYGSRYLNKQQKNKNIKFVKKHIRQSFFAFMGGRAVTKFCNLLFGSKLTDEPTCYKAFDSKLLKGINLVSNGFELEPELTAKVLKKTSILEVPIRYYPRTIEEGKKINWKDGLKAIWALIKYRVKD